MKQPYFKFKIMDLITITAIDQHSSDTMSRTFSVKPISTFKESIEEFEEELPFRRYELMCDELMDDYSQYVLDVLEELEVTY